MAQIWTKVFYYDVFGAVKCGKGYSKVGEIWPTLAATVLFNLVTLIDFVYISRKFSLSLKQIPNPHFSFNTRLHAVVSLGGCKSNYTA